MDTNEVVPIPKERWQGLQFEYGGLFNIGQTRYNSFEEVVNTGVFNAAINLDTLEIRKR